MEDKEKLSSFFKETFLLANFHIDITLGIVFLFLSNFEINFVNQDLLWKMYTIAKTLMTMNNVELIRKKMFKAIAFDPKNKAFIVHIASISPDLDVYSSGRI